MRASAADILPGTITFELGTLHDYRALAHFHYAPGDPATRAGVWRAVYRDLRLPICDLRLEEPVARSLSSNRKSQIANRNSPRLVAVAVLSYPTPALRQRERALGLEAVGRAERYGERLRWLNANLRTISRVIVHPQFRALGIAAKLVRRVCEDCDVRYVEALAAMGEVHPFFEKGGMRRVTPAGGVEEPAAYFIRDREEHVSC